MSERSLEEAPSEVRTDELAGTQLVGLTGMGLAALGVIVVVASISAPRIIPVSWAYLMTAAGLVAMFYHALRDTSVEIRRAYMYFAAGLLVLAVAAAVVPGPFLNSSEPKKELGYHFLPWSPLFGFLGLVFLVTPLRHETDAKFLRYGLTLTLAVGAILCLGSVALAVANPDTIVGPGVLLGILGLGFVSAFLSRVDTTDGPGHLVASLLGLLGGAALLYAFGRSAVPTLLYEGPPALKNAYQAFDTWKVLARAAIVLAFLGFAAWAGLNKNLPAWLRGGLAVIGVGFAGVFAISAVATFALPAPKPFLVPSGLLLGGLGVVYLAVSLGIVSDSPFVTMTRRELSSYFYSPIAYIVLLGMSLLTWIGYLLFVVFNIARAAGPLGESPPIAEPILSEYYPGSLVGPLVVLLLVPALTMRLFSEEKRTGTIEVLLTAPVNELTIVLSKLFACWLFFMFCWVPLGLYLIALRFEGGQPFDYRPLLSLYIAIGVSGLAMVGMGLFFSSLTRNQVIAAVLTFVGVLTLFVLNWLGRVDYFPKVVRDILGALAHASYWRLWVGSLSGQLPVRDLLIQASLAVFWVYLTLKSIEARKWL
jgi:hypothetical protein